MPKLEKVEIATIYKEEGIIGINFNFDTKDYEIYGFLKCLVIDMEKELTEQLKKK